MEAWRKVQEATQVPHLLNTGDGGLSVCGGSGEVVLWWWDAKCTRCLNIDASINGSPGAQRELKKRGIK